MIYHWKTISRNSNISFWHSFPSYSIKIRHLSALFFKQVSPLPFVVKFGGLNIWNIIPVTLYFFELCMTTYRWPCRHVQHDYKSLSNLWDQFCFSILTSTHSGHGNFYCCQELIFIKLLLHSNDAFHNVKYIIE